MNRNYGLCSSANKVPIFSFLHEVITDNKIVVVLGLDQSDYIEHSLSILISRVCCYSCIFFKLCSCVIFKKYLLLMEHISYCTNKNKLCCISCTRFHWHIQDNQECCYNRDFGRHGYFEGIWYTLRICTKGTALDRHCH